MDLIPDRLHVGAEKLYNCLKIGMIATAIKRLQVMFRVIEIQSAMAPKATKIFSCVSF